MTVKINTKGRSPKLTDEVVIPARRCRYWDLRCGWNWAKCDQRCYFQASQGRKLLKKVCCCQTTELSCKADVYTVLSYGTAKSQNTPRTWNLVWKINLESPDTNAPYSKISRLWENIVLIITTSLFQEMVRLCRETALDRIQCQKRATYPSYFWKCFDEDQYVDVLTRLSNCPSGPSTALKSPTPHRCNFWSQEITR